MRHLTERARIVGTLAVLAVVGSAPAPGAAETPATRVDPANPAIEVAVEIERVDLTGTGPVVAEQRRAVPRSARPRQRPPRTVRPRPPGRTTIVVRSWYPWHAYYHPYYGYWYGSWYPRYWVPMSTEYDDTGTVRLKVKPKHAEVFVDGYFVGRVDDFDGSFQSLRLEAGPAHLDVRAADFRNLSVDVMILPGRKLTYEAQMRPGAPTPVEPILEDVSVDAELERAPSPGVEREVPPPVLGSVRLDIEPEHAQVFIEGYYVGVVADFSGGHGLPLESGPQTLEVRAEGYEPLELRIRILAGETTTYRGVLRPSPGLSH